EQDLAALHGRSELVAQVPRHDDAVERGGAARARDLLRDQRELRVRLVELGAQDVDLGPLALRERVALLTLDLRLLARPAQELQPQIAIVDAEQRIAFGDDVARPHVRLDDVTGDRRDGYALDRALERRLRLHTVSILRDAEENGDGDRDHYGNLPTHVARADEARGLLARRVVHLASYPPVLPVLGREHGPQERRDPLYGNEAFVGQQAIRRGLERQRAERGAAIRERDRADVAVAALRRERRMRAVDLDLALLGLRKH